MRPTLAAIAACLTLAAGAAPAERLRLLDTPAAIYGLEAVGRIDYRGDGRSGFCTGTLVARSLVLTAAHCVVDADGALRTAGSLTFRAGLRRGRAKSEHGVRRIAVHPGYRHRPAHSIETVGTDLALLELDRPLDYWSVPPLRTVSGMERGQSVQVVSYAEGRDDTPSREAACSVLDRSGPVLALDCQATFGASGAPVFVSTSDGLRIVSVVSAIGRSGDRQVTFAVAVEDAVPMLTRALPGMAAQPVRVATPGSRRLQVGDRTGADSTIRFLRPGG